jgi:hypothetical protein
MTNLTAETDEQLYTIALEKRKAYRLMVKHYEQEGEGK